MKALQINKDLILNRTRCCVNPDHLETVTRRENHMRSPLRLRGNQAIVAKRRAATNCRRGHKYDRAPQPNKYRCSICHDMWWDAYNEWRRESRRVRNAS